VLRWRSCSTLAALAGVQIAALVDRSGRELPIHPDYTGIKIDLPPQERVSVRFAEHDGWDEVFVRHWEGRPA